MMKTDSISLSTLLSPWLEVQSQRLAEYPVQNLVLDSRQVSSGDIFVAVKGHQLDGRQFIDTAIDKGAAVIIADADSEHPHGEIEVRQSSHIIYFHHLSMHLSTLAGRRYTHTGMQLVAVTGTNGKTTISQLIAQWLELIGHNAAVMGTTGNGFLNHLKTSMNTTGSAIEIQALLSQFKAQKADYACLEVSSHGLVQHRVKGLEFSAAVYSNLSRDHLDYHGDMQSYAAAKYLLFSEHTCQHKIINADDEVGAQWLANMPDAIAVSLHKPDLQNRCVWADSVEYTDHGICIHFNGDFGQGSLQVPLIGEFNASNVMLAFTTLLSLGFDKSLLLATAMKLRPVIGRMELFHAPHQAKVIVDYAHTPDALAKALAALRIHCRGKLWAIFGCGGDRDTGKRPLMAQVGEELADYCVLTDDNPRSEDPALIIKDMQAGLKHPENAFVIHSRFTAIQHALSQANENDVILVAGKGHEDYQIIGKEVRHYSDRESAQQLLGECS